LHNPNKFLIFAKIISDTMSKKLSKITKEQIYNLARAARRKSDIAEGKTHFKHKAHKMATDYNRQKAKRITLD
jgi:hypothetical protein